MQAADASGEYWLGLRDLMMLQVLLVYWIFWAIFSLDMV